MYSSRFSTYSFRSTVFWTLKSSFSLIFRGGYTQFQIKNVNVSVGYWEYWTREKELGKREMERRTRCQYVVNLALNVFGNIGAYRTAAQIYRVS